MEGDYSKLEKDFLGNERMVHYNAEGVAISASSVTRGEDGSMTVGEPMPLQSSAAQPASEPVAEPKGSYTSGTVATIGIASFVVAALAALLVLNLNRGSDSEVARYNRDVYQSPTQPSAPSGTTDDSVPPPQDLQPDSRPDGDGFGPPPGDTDRPRILRENEPAEEPPVEQSKPEKEPEPEAPKKSSDDPIDLRGDGEESR